MVILLATVVRPSSVDLDKVKKCIKYLIIRPDLKVPQAMKLTNLSVQEVANLLLRRFIQRSLPGKTLHVLKAHMSRSLLPPPPPPQPDRAERRLNRAIDDEGALVKPGSHACTCDSFSLAASATSCGNAPKWAIIISQMCFFPVGTPLRHFYRQKTRSVQFPRPRRYSGFAWCTSGVRDDIWWGNIFGFCLILSFPNFPSFLDTVVYTA